MLGINKKDIIKKRIPAVDKFCLNPLKTAKEWILSVCCLSSSFFSNRYHLKTITML